jgi:hypothetical protein
VTRVIAAELRETYCVQRKERPMFTRKTSFVSLTWVFAVGAVAGAAAALLYAPMTGRKFQKKVAGVTDKVIDKVDDIKSAVLKVANG